MVEDVRGLSPNGGRSNKDINSQKRKIKVLEDLEHPSDKKVQDGLVYDSRGAQDLL